MKRKASKATRRSISVFRQVIQEVLPGHKIDELAANEKVKAREFPYSSQLYLLMLGQFLHLFSLNELVDVSNVYASELRGTRQITPAKRNTFSYANRTRNPEVAEKFFWLVHGMLTKEHPKFAAGRRKGALAKFHTRGIYAIDSTTIQLAYCCMPWAKHRQRKAAVKVHMVADVPSRLPRFCVIGKASEHDSKREDELLASLKAGDVAVLDRAYNAFPALYGHHRRGGVFVVREKDGMKAKVVRRVPKGARPKGILADERIRLTGRRTSKAYPEEIRRVRALVEVDGQTREMTFLTNRLDWSATTVAALYKSRWEVEILFKELKQTLQLQDFYGENENAVKWQIWSALLAHLVLRYLKFRHGADCSYTRFVAFIRAIVWLKKDLLSVLRSYGIAPGRNTGESGGRMPYLPGFEKHFLESVG